MTISLRAARVNAGYSQKEAAKRLNISKYTLSKYENYLEFPEIVMIKRIESLYSIDYKNISFTRNTVKK